MVFDRISPSDLSVDIYLTQSVKILKKKKYRGVI